MSVEILQEPIMRKARKRCLCSYCGQFIEIGEEYEDRILADDGVYHWRNHKECIVPCNTAAHDYADFDGFPMYGGAGFRGKEVDEK